MISHAALRRLSKVTAVYQIYANAYDQSSGKKRAVLPTFFQLQSGAIVSKFDVRAEIVPAMRSLCESRVIS